MIGHHFRIKDKDLDSIKFKNKLFSVHKYFGYIYLDLQIDEWSKVSLYSWWVDDIDAMLQQLDEQITKIENFGLDKLINSLIFLNKETDFHQIIYQQGATDEILAQD